MDDIFKKLDAEPPICKYFREHMFENLNLTIFKCKECGYVGEFTEKPNFCSNCKSKNIEKT